MVYSEILIIEASTIRIKHISVPLYIYIKEKLEYDEARRY